MPHEFINPPGLFDPVPRGFSHVVRAQSGNLVFIAGQAAADPTPRIVSTDFGDQVRQALANLGTALRAAGLDYPHVVQTHTYVVDLDADKAQAVIAAEREIWGAQLPTQSLIGVAALAHPQAWFEIDAIAVRS